MSEQALPLMLKELRLPTFAKHFHTSQKKALEQSWSYNRYLATLAEQEIATRFQARVYKWTREARLPKGKSFATLKLEDLPEPVMKKVADLRDNTQWALQADNVLLIGPSGVGNLIVPLLSA